MHKDTATDTIAAPYSRTNPFPAKMLVNRRLSGPDSEKDTRHFELSLEGWGLSFEVGESVAIYPTNWPSLVDQIMEALGAMGDEIVPNNRGVPTSFREALLRDYSITQPTPKILRAIAEPLDHVFLNEIEPFRTENPSAENIARYFCEKMQQGLEQSNPVEIAEVKVWETDIQSATYRPGPGR